VKHLFDHRGVLLSVDYTPGPVIEFHSVHATDHVYRTVGPDLMPLLHDTLVRMSETTDTVECQTFLSCIVDDIEASHGPK
jgi:hypothetical protein